MNDGARKLSLPFLFILIAAAIGLRLLYTYQIQSNPFYDAPIVDSQTFYQHALKIADGNLLGDPEPFWQAPLYPYFLGLLCWLFPDSSFIAIRIVQAILGAISCGLIFLIARKSFNEIVGKIAAIFAAGYGTFIYFDGELLSTPVEIFLNLLLLLRLQIATERDRVNDWVFVGIITGLSAITRPNILLFSGAVLIWVLGQRRYWVETNSPPAQADDANATRNISRSTYVRGLFLTISIVAVILPISARNYVIGNDPVLISSNGGINFYIGNNAAYDSTVAIHPGLHWENLVMEPVRADHKTPSERSTYFVHAGLDYILEQPVDYGILLGKKLWLFWNGSEIKRNAAIYYLRNHSTILSTLMWEHLISFPFGLISPLALIGLVLTWRHRSPLISILRLYALSYILSVVIFFVTARYRAPVVPVLIIFAAVGVGEMVRRIRKDVYRATPLLVTFGALVIMFNWEKTEPWEKDAQLFHDLGEVALRKNDYETCIEHSLHALELETPYPSARHNAAVAYLHLDDLDAARVQALRAVRENPLRADTRTVLGQVYLAMGAFPAAERQLRRSLDSQPNLGVTHYHLGHLLLNRANYNGAIWHLVKSINLGTADFWAHYDLGQAYYKSGSVTEALTNFEIAHHTDPSQPEAAFALGATHLLSGNLLDARLWTQTALAQDPNRTEGLVNLGLIELASDQPTAAVAALEKALRTTRNPKSVYPVLIKAYNVSGQPQRARALSDKLLRP